MRTRRLSPLALIPALLVFVAAPAVADTGSGGGWIDGGTPTAEVRLPGGGGRSARQAGSGGEGGTDSDGTDSGGGDGDAVSRCIYELVPESERLIEPDGTERVKPGEGQWYVERCLAPDGMAEISWNVVFVPDGTASGEQVDPEVLAQQALERLPLAGPPVVTSPPPERDQLVNLATWLWVDDSWEPVSAAAEVPGVSVTVTAEPRSVEWVMGTGDVVVCDGPGTPYDPGVGEAAQSTDCSYTYRRSSAAQVAQRYPVTATQIWSVSWSATGISGGGDLGEVTRSTELSLRVAEGQALVTGSR